jgi:hypothetical protein
VCVCVCVCKGGGGWGVRVEWGGGGHLGSAEWVCSGQGVVCEEGRKARVQQRVAQGQCAQAVLPLLLVRRVDQQQTSHVSAPVKGECARLHTHTPDSAEGEHTWERRASARP